jgi:histidinol-phosphatase (PHP family)
MGVEIDYQKWFEDRIRSYLVEHAFDFVIGSVHYVNRAMLMTPAHTAGRSAEQAYRAYFGAIRDSVESGLFDIVGHLEYANRRGLAAYGPYDQAPFREQVGEIFRLMIDRGVALEINTAGLRQGVGTTYPCEAHVALYADMGGRLLTIGSDSHHPDELADGYSFAADLALRHGLSAVYTWQERTPSVRALRTI